MGAGTVSTPNRTVDICSRCKTWVPAGTGTIKHYNGAARRYAPKYAMRSAMGMLSLCHCVKCEQELTC